MGTITYNASRGVNQGFLFCVGAGEGREEEDGKSGAPRNNNLFAGNRNQIHH